MKEHFNNTTNTKEGTDGQQLKIKKECDMGFLKPVKLTVFTVNMIKISFVFHLYL